jgi:copper transporter 1
MDHSSHDHHMMDHSGHGGMDHGDMGGNKCNMNVRDPFGPIPIGFPYY